MIEGGILVGDFEGGAGAIDSSDLRTAWGEVKGEAALIAEDVEGIAVSVPGGSGIVFALVEEGSGLLAFKSVKAELDSIHGEGGRGLLALKEAGDARRESFEFANARIDALDDGGWMQAGSQFGEDRLAHGVGVHGLGENLD
jgi:hypothetical protein